MKLRLPHRLHAALVAALASVSFATLSTGTLAAAFFLGNQTFAEDTAEESTDPESDSEIPEFNIGYTDPEASPEESDEQQKKLVDQATIKANEVGSNGVIGSSDGANQAAAMENGDDSPISFANEASPAQTVVTPGVAESNPADDLGFTTQVTDVTTPAASAPVFQMPTAAPAVQQLAVETTAQETTASTTNTTSTGSSGSTTSPLGIGTSGWGLSAPYYYGNANGNGLSSTLSQGSAGADTPSGTSQQIKQINNLSPTSQTKGNAKITWNDTPSRLYSWQLNFTFTAKDTALNDFFNISSNHNTAQIGWALGLDGTTLRLTDGGKWKTSLLEIENAFELNTGIAVTFQFERYVDSDGNAVGGGIFTLIAGDKSASYEIASSTAQYTDTYLESNSRGHFWCNNAKDGLQKMTDITLFQLADIVEHPIVNWAGTSGNNTWQAQGVWENGATFTNGDNVVFGNGTDVSKTVIVNSAIAAHEMTVDGDYTFNVSAAGSLAADSMTGSGSFTKTGAGTATFGGADAGGVALSALSISEGTASFNGSLAVSGNVTMSRGAETDSTLNLNGNAVVGGTVNATAGTINVAGETSFASLNMGDSSTAEIVVKDKGILTLHQLSLSDGSKLTLEKGGKADLLGEVWLEGLEGNGEVLGTGTCSIDSADVTLKNVAVTAQGRVDIGNKLEGSTITIDTSYVSLTNAANTLTTTTVNGAWLDVQAGMQLGDVAVNGGELRLTSSSPVTINSGSIGSAGKLTLSEAEQFTVSGGEFSFASGSTLDLSALSIDGSTPITLGTASGTGSISSHNLGNVILYFGPESTYDNAFLEVDANHNLVLNFAVPKEVLYWKGGPGTWDTDPENKSWYASGDVTKKVAFEGGENIVFSVQGESVVTVTEQTLTTGDVVVEQGVNLSLSSANGTALEAGKVDVKGNLTVSNVAVTATSLNIERGSRVTADVEGTRAGALATNVSGAGDVVKKGAGSLTLTGDNAEFSGTVTIEEGTLIAGGDAGTALGDSPNVVLNGGELKGAITPGDDIHITAAKDGATVSADIQVAEDKALTFNTNGGVTLTTSGNISGKGDVYKSGTGTLVLDAANSFTGNLDINAGTVLVSNVGAVSGSSNVTVGTGSNLVFEKDPSAYDVNQITLDRGSTLTFSGAVGLGETPLLHIDTLDLTSAAAMDFSNIPLDKTGSYVLASVDNIVASEPGIWRPGQELLQFITMQGINGAARTPDTLTSLYYRNGQLILDLKDPNSGFYWKPSDDDEVQSWNETDPRWSSKSDLSGDPVNFTNNDPRTGATPKSVYFLDAGTDGKEKVQLDIESYTTYINDLVIANGEYWFIAPEGEIKDIHMQTEVLSNFVVREGAKAHFEGVSVSDGNFNVIHVCAGAEASVEGMPTWGVYSMNNEGKFSVVSDLMGIENLLAHVDNSGVMSILYHDSAEGMAMVGELSNRAGAEMTIAAPFLMSDFMGSYGDGVLHNMGELTYDVTGYDQTGRMETYLPIDGTGSFKTIGAEATVALGETVVQSSMELGAGRTEFTGLVTISDSTTVKDGAEAVLSAGGTLGEVTLESNATLQLEGDGTTPKIYRGGTLVAGEGSVLKVDEDASLTIDSYNAGASAPVGAIEVGGGSGNPALLTVEGKTNAASLTVYDGEAHLHGGGSVTSLTQSGGTARFCSDAYLGGGSVTGGTLLVEDGQELTVGSEINVTSGNYTVAATTGSINASALELTKTMGNIKYHEAVSGAATETQSGFLSGGEQYVKVFDVKEGGSLTGHDVTVTHKEAAGSMKLIGSNDSKYPQFAGYGYLDTSKTVYASYYVRDNYVSGQHGTRAGSDRSPDSVKLSDVMTAANGQLETVVFDVTDYNKNETAVTGSLTVDVQGQHADLFDVKEGSVGIVNIGTDAGGERVMLCCCEDFDKVDGTMLIAGTGIYQLENRGDLGGGVSLLSTKTEGIEAWTGTVRITGSGEQLELAPLAVGSGSTASEIEFSQWTGSFENKGETVVSDARILLTGTGMDAAPAITLAPGDADMKWTNTVTGNNARIVNHEGGNFSLTMTGDTSGWNGTLDQGRAGTTMNVSFLLDTTTASGQGANATVQNAGLLTHDGIMNATYGGGIMTVNGDVLVYENGTINLHYTGTEMQVNSNIEKFLKQGKLSITVGDGSNQASATFSGKFTNTETTTMTVEAGSSATIDTDATLLRVVGGQGSSVNVTGGSTLSLASTDPAASYSRFYGVNNQGTISMMASGGDIKLVDTTTTSKTYELGDLRVVGTPGTAAIETSGLNGPTTNVNITALSGTTDVLKLTNDNGVGTVNYNLGGEDSTAEFSGTVAYGVKAGTGGAAANLVLKDGKVAANAVLETSFAAEQPPVMKALLKGASNEADPSTANIVVDTAHAEVLGLSSDATSEGKSMKVYGTGAHTAQGAANNSLEITGDGNYEYAGKLGENLDIAYTGTGSQTIKGGVDNFNGAVTVESKSAGAGTLAIQNLLDHARVNITDLTIGASDTLDLNDGSNVGTAVVTGTLEAKGGPTTGSPSTASVLDGNLTLASGSTYDVHAAGGTGGLQLTGALTIETGAKLSTNDLTGVLGLGWFGMYDLAWDVDDMSSFGVDVDWTKGVDASTVFGNEAFGGRKEEFYIRYSTGTGGNGNNVGAVYIYRIPEPTTGTLSLLALAALAARRRRK